MKEKITDVNLNNVVFIQERAWQLEALSDLFSLSHAKFLLGATEEE